MPEGPDDDYFATAEVKKQRDSSELRDAKWTRKFLITDMDHYLKDTRRDKEDWISKAKCIGPEKKVLQFKYRRNLQTTYSTQHSKTGASPRQQQFNLDEEKKRIRIPFHPPGTFATNYGDNFADQTGTDKIGAFDKHGNSPNKPRKGPIGMHELMSSLPRKFEASTSYRMQFAGHHKLPEANVRKYESSHRNVGRFYGQTSYGSNFVNRHDKSYIEGIIRQNQKAKELKELNQRGSISPPGRLPSIAK